MTQELEDRCLAAQQSIIGSMLIDDRCIGDVMAAIRPEDFPSGTCKSTFCAVRKLFLDGKPIDPITVVDAIQGGEKYVKYLGECMDVTPTSANVLDYCGIVKRLTRLSRVNDLALQLTGSPSVEDAQGIVDKINGLMVENSGITYITAADLAVQFFDRMHADAHPEYITSGFKTLDETTFLELGDMVGIGAAPSVGKTALAIQWAVHAAEKYRVGFYSLETNANKFTDRMIAHAAPVPLSDIKKRILPDAVWAKLNDACSKISSLKLEFIPAAGLTASDIVSSALSRRYQIIFVDYLQLVSGEGKRGEDRYSIVTNSSLILHQAAQTHGIMVVLLSQLSRPEKVKGKYIPPDMHSFRESGQIEQDLDVALLISQADPDNYRSNRKVKIGKNKENEKGSFELSFDGRTQTFSEYYNTGSELRKMANEEKKKNHKGEAYDSDLPGQQDLKEITDDESALPF